MANSEERKNILGQNWGRRDADEILRPMAAYLSNARPATFILSLQVCESLSPHSLFCLCTSSRLSRKNTTSYSLTFSSLSRKTHDRRDWFVFLSSSFSRSLVQKFNDCRDSNLNQASQPTVFRYNDYWINNVWNDEDEKSRSIFPNSALEIPVGNTPDTTDEVIWTRPRLLQSKKRCVCVCVKLLIMFIYQLLYTQYHQSHISIFHRIEVILILINIVSYIYNSSIKTIWMFPLALSCEKKKRKENRISSLSSSRV